MLLALLSPILARLLVPGFLVILILPLVLSNDVLEIKALPRRVSLVHLSSILIAHPPALLLEALDTSHAIFVLLCFLPESQPVLLRCCTPALDLIRRHNVEMTLKHW
jgi:hypothetical protein